MFRQHIRRGIRSVQDGRAPAGLQRDAGAVIPTRANDTVVYVPPAATPGEDAQLLRETGWKLAEAYLKDPPLVAAR
jgi:hypothetical protein